ncbi:MAG: hypothetical protein U0930_03265 [Pirellulales bacterium]
MKTKSIVIAFGLIAVFTVTRERETSVRAVPAENPYCNPQNLNSSVVQVAKGENYAPISIDSELSLKDKTITVQHVSGQFKCTVLVGENLVLLMEGYPTQKLEVGEKLAIDITVKITEFLMHANKTFYYSAEFIK